MGLRLRLAVSLAVCVFSITAASPLFEVASIKPVEPKPGSFSMTGTFIYPGGRVVISNSTIQGMIKAAYGVSDWQISSTETWINSENFDLDARPSEEARTRVRSLRYSWFTIEDATLREMLQAVLAERCGLKVHRETKPGEVYLLKRSDRPLRLQPAQEPDPKAPPEMAGFSSVGFAGRWVISNTSMPQLANWATNYVLHTPALDRTGLSGHFDYKQRPSLSDKETGDSVSFHDLMKEVGLKLERSTGLVDVLVVDRVERPSRN